MAQYPQCYPSGCYPCPPYPPCPPCPPPCKKKCYEACVKCKCCGEKRKVKFEVEVDCCTVAAQAQLAGSNQAYSTTASTILFNSVTLNETCYRPKKQKCKCKGNCGCWPPAPSPWCMFYNPSTGLATVPPEGGGLYFIVASVQSDTANTSTVEIRVNNVAVATAQVGDALGPGDVVTLSAFQPLCPGQTVNVVIYDDTGAANVIAGASTKLDIARIR